MTHITKKCIEICLPITKLSINVLQHIKTDSEARQHLAPIQNYTIFLTKVTWPKWCSWILTKSSKMKRKIKFIIQGLKLDPLPKFISVDKTSTQDKILQSACKIIDFAECLICLFILASTNRIILTSLNKYGLFRD